MSSPGKARPAPLARSGEQRVCCLASGFGAFRRPERPASVPQGYMLFTGSSPGSASADPHRRSSSRRKGYAAAESNVPGVLFLEIDGLAHEVLTASSSGMRLVVADWCDAGGYLVGLELGHAGRRQCLGIMVPWLPRGGARSRHRTYTSHSATLLRLLRLRYP